MRSDPENFMSFGRIRLSPLWSEHIAKILNFYTTWVNLSWSPVPVTLKFERRKQTYDPLNSAIFHCRRSNVSYVSPLHSANPKSKLKHFLSKRNKSRCNNGTTRNPRANHSVPCQVVTFTSPYQLGHQWAYISPPIKSTRRRYFRSPGSI